MQRDTLVSILRRAEALTEEKERFVVQKEHQVTLYLGPPGRAMLVGKVESVTPREDHLEVHARDHGTIYVDYDAVSGLAEQPSKESSKKGRGFGFG